MRPLLPSGSLRNLAHRPGESHHLDSPSTTLPKRGRSGGNRGSARVDVVDENKGGRGTAEWLECTAEVTAAVGKAQPPLLLHPPCPPEQRLDGKLPDVRKGPREALGWMVSSPDAPIPVRWNVGKRAVRGSGKYGREDAGGKRRETAKAPFLPGGDNRAHPVVVGDCGPGMRERETPAGAFRTADDGPCRGGAAACAEGRPDSRQEVRAVRAELLAGQSADEAANGEDEVQNRCHPRQPSCQEASDLCRNCAKFCAAFLRGRRPERLGFRPAVSA